VADDSTRVHSALKISDMFVGIEVKLNLQGDSKLLERYK